jgi:2-polyprenyl-3-methyl-5-hydroxy-6-metoxy-1,4-benzoquinol methylase
VAIWERFPENRDLSSATMSLDARFRFGENWQSFSATIDSESITEAQNSLKILLKRDTLDGLRFLDIGCGSGLFSLAARNLGAIVHSFDFDTDSVLCTRSLRDSRRPSDPEWMIEQGSILDDNLVMRVGTFDIVYAWGVLHHTGSMRHAIENAARLVNPGGMLAIALYRKTFFCPLWSIEKRWYASASPRAQRMAVALYVSAMRARLLLTGKSFNAYVASYKNNLRAMDFEHNVRDWLGGYPYESIRRDDVIDFVSKLSFECAHMNCERQSIGLFGSGCDEFVFRSSEAKSNEAHPHLARG